MSKHEAVSTKSYSSNAPLGRAVFHWAARYRGPVELGWYDFVTVFKGSYLGALWPSFQLGAWVLILTLLFGNSLGEGFVEYALYVGIGFFVWEFIAAALSDGPGHFVHKSVLIKNVPTKLSSITVRKTAQLWFRSLCQLPVPIVVLLLAGQDIGWPVLLIIPAVPLFLVSAFSALTILGAIGAYFRDFQFLMPNITRLLFFTTPIFWRGDAGFRKVISDYNPFSYYLELVRAPLSGDMASTKAWIVVVAFSGVSFLLAWWVQAKFRNEIIYRI